MIWKTPNKNVLIRQTDAMDLDEQIQILIQEAPQDGSTPALVQAIAPVLKHLAQQLRHPQYYIVQTLDQDWAITTIGSREQPEVQKVVVYAYPTLKDVSSGPYPMQDPQMIALPIPVTHILFQMLAVEQVNSIIFFESPGNTIAGTEINRTELVDLVQSHLEVQAPMVPPDIA
jgi:hypothetical protein